MTGRPAGISVVIPTLGRPSLSGLLTALDRRFPADVPIEIVVVDDRRRPGAPLPVPVGLADATTVLRGRSAGPAAARNVGWRQAGHEWVAFLDDDVFPDPDWWQRLVADLSVGSEVGGVQGRVRVPLPAGRRPTDWERVTAGLSGGAWITADMAYRRSALAAVGGFDERFPRAFREDAELAYRVRAAGWRLCRGGRAVTHPVRPESRWVSVRAQRGNADDALLRRLYGAGWRAALDVPPGRRRRHGLVVAAGGVAAGCLAAAVVRRRRGFALTAAGSAAAWLAGTAEFAAARIAPGPKTRTEVITMALSSAMIPPLATFHWWLGWCRSRGQRPITVAPAALIARPADRSR